MATRKPDAIAILGGTGDQGLRRPPPSARRGRPPAGRGKASAAALAPGQIVVSMGVPLATAIGDGAVRTVGVWQGSCAELVESLMPEGITVVSAFQNVSSHR